MRCVLLWTCFIYWIRGFVNMASMGEVMRKIYKYELKLDCTFLQLPREARVLSAGNQRGNLCIWVEMTEHGSITRKFLTIGTGHEMPAGENVLTFIDTVIIEPFVWHVFEEKL